MNVTRVPALRCPACELLIPAPLDWENAPEVEAFTKSMHEHASTGHFRQPVSLIIDALRASATPKK